MKRVLVVDDEAIQRRAMALGLKLEGFDVESVDGGAKALERLESGGVDVVLVDLMMPRVNGLELARLIRAKFPGLGVVLTSAYPLSGRQIERLGLGPIAFVPKPSPLPLLASRLRAAMGELSDPTALMTPAPAPEASRFGLGLSRRT